MERSNDSIIALSFRTYYGRLFSSLLHQFGTSHISTIEDAIQNAFYKSLKSWKPDRIPDDKESWLYIVAKNDILNQIRKGSKSTSLDHDFSSSEEDINDQEDLRLKTLLFLSKIEGLSSKIKVVFILKNIFGLHVKEISSATLISEEAIYKILKRAKRNIKEYYQDLNLDSTLDKVDSSELSLLEEVLYAVFNIGYDSFSEKQSLAIDEDLCIEALALAKLLWEQSGAVTTQNLMGLFCFHIARIPAKIKESKMVSFFQQNKEEWKPDFISLGFHYMEQPQQLNKYYIEALIVSAHMTASKLDEQHWDEIIRLYDVLQSLSVSPIISINKCYCLYKAGRNEKAKLIIEDLESQLPEDHIYLSLLKSMISDEVEGDRILEKVLGQLNQRIRKEFVVENLMTT